MPSQRKLPSGRVTLLFTDIESSSRMANALGDAVYAAALREPHHARIRAAVQAHGGHVVKTIGDSFMVAFERADDALACAAAIQRCLASPPIVHEHEGERWEVRVRIGVHTADRELAPHPEDDYGGADVNFAARVEGLGAGGQVLVSDSTHRAAGTRETYAWQDWPNRRIRSFDQPETVWELRWDGRPSRGEPGQRWLPDWFRGEQNRYISRPELESQIHAAFVPLSPDGSVSRLVTLHGTGGMGKTRLAVSAAVQAAGLFAGGVYFVALAERLSSPESVAESIGAALGLSGEAALPDNLIAALARRDCLLLLDNYETVACEDVRDFLADLLVLSSNLRFLVSSREAVQLYDVEQCVPVGGMADDEARALLEARVRLKMGPQWQPGDGDNAAIKWILELTDRIPLALELAAAWSANRTLPEIAAGIVATPLGCMSAAPAGGGTIQLSERHRSLTRCLDWSLALLHESTRDGFACLALFADSFSAESAAAVCELPDAHSLLDRLAQAALVRRHEADGRSRYDLLRPTRAYAAARLDRLGDARSIRERFVAHYRRLAEVEGGLRHLLTVPRLRVLDREWRNAAGAAATAEKLGDGAAVVSLSSHLCDFLLLRGLWSEGEQLGVRALAAARQAGDRHGEGKTLNNLGNVYQAQGRLQEAETAHQESLAITREFGDRHGEGRTLNNLGNVYQAQGRWQEAETAHQESLAITREFGDRHGEGQTLNNLALLREAHHDSAGALPFAREAVDVLSTTQDRAALEKARRTMKRLEQRVGSPPRLAPTEPRRRPPH